MLVKINALQFRGAIGLQNALMEPKPSAPPRPHDLNGTVVAPTELLFGQHNENDVRGNLENILQNQPSDESTFTDDPPLPPPDFDTDPSRPPLIRKFSVNQDFQEGHELWHDGYQGYLAAGAGEEIEEVPNGNSNENFIDAQIGDRRGYIPKEILTDQ